MANADSADVESGEFSEKDITVTEPGVIRRAVGAAAIGNVTEWFDFGVYSYLAVKIESVFFSGLSPTMSTIATLGTFAAAFLVRPFGGLFFGPLGDRIGRQKVLSLTVIMMAISTFIIGILPDYRTIGVTAPMLLLLARLLQGFSTGGEYGGAMTFIAEYTPDRRRGFFSSWLEFGTLTGFITGAGLVSLLTAVLSEQDMLAWGWRLPFLIALPIGVVGLYLRWRLGETPAFAALAGREERARTSKQLRAIFVENRRPMLLCMALVLNYNIAYYMFFSYMPTYVSAELSGNISETEANLLQVGTIAVMLVLITFVGRLSDRIGRRPVILGGSLATLVLAVPSVALIRVDTTAAVFAGLLLMGLMVVSFAATMTSALPALFPTEVRQGALSVSFNVSVSLFGGTVASVMTALIASTGDLMWPAYYLMAAGVIGVVAVRHTAETANTPLKGSPPTVEPGHEASAQT